MALRGRSGPVGAGAPVLSTCLAAFGAAAAGAGRARVLTVFPIGPPAVLGIAIHCGNSGIVSFGHLAFMGLGIVFLLPPRRPNGLIAARNVAGAEVRSRS